jgi:hypothetical protein
VLCALHVWHPILTRSKTALLGVARNLAHEWAAAGVRVNAIAPGIIKTQFSELLWKNEAATEAALQRIPLGRLGESHEIASVAAFLASSDANYVTGETIVVSGGMQASRLWSDSGARHRRQRQVSRCAFERSVPGRAPASPAGCVCFLQRIRASLNKEWIWRTRFTFDETFDLYSGNENLIKASLQKAPWYRTPTTACRKLIW